MLLFFQVDLPKGRRHEVIRIQPLLQAVLFWGVGLLLVVAPLWRGLYYYLELAQAQIWLGALFVLYGIYRYLEKKKKLTLSRLDILLLIYLAANILSLFTAVQIKEALVEVFRVSNYLLLFMLVRDLAHELKWRNRFVTLLFAGSALLTAVSFLASLGYLQLADTAYQAGKTFVTPPEYENAYAIMAAAGVILGAGLFGHYRTLWAKLLTGMGVCLNLTGILVSNSRGTWVLLGILLIVYLLGKGSKGFWQSFYFLAITLLIAFITNKRYLEALTATEFSSARNWLIAGLAIAGLGVYLLAKIPLLLERYRLRRQYSLVLPWVVAIGLVIIGSVYFTHTVNLIPTGGGEILSGDVAAQAASISGQDGSFQMRLEMSKMAWRMALDRPLLGAGGGGWNALYHQYQDYFYWSSKTHNHYLQIAVESGLPGFIGYLGFWLGLLLAAAGYFFKRRGKSSWPLTQSVSIALLAILLHSAFDFELSMAACAMVLWALGGLLAAQLGRKSRGSGKGLLLKQRGAVPALAALLVLYGLFSAGAGLREHQSQALAREGVQTLENGRYEESIGYYEQALSLSPLSGEFAANLAQLHAYMYLTTGQAEHQTRAYETAEQAVKLAPGYIPGSQKTAQAYLFLGDREARLKEQVRLTAIAPKLVGGWSALAASYREQAQDYLERRNPGEARTALTEICRIMETVEDNYILAKKKPIMRPENRLYLFSGQAAALLGRTEEAEKWLAQALKIAETKTEAGIWLTGLYEQTDEKKHASYFKTYLQNNPENQAVLTQIQRWFDIIN